MKSVLLGASGLRISEFCLGTATFGEDVWGAGRQECSLIFEAYLEAGGRFIDVSNTYGGGRSEEIVGDLVATCRDELVIGTKFTAITRPGDPNAWGNHRKSLRQSLNTSLRRLKTDYVDILWMHAWEGLTPLDEIMRALDDEIRSGKVLYVGVSNTPAWAIARANTLAELKGWSPFVGLQTEYSLVSRTPEHELIPMAQHLGLRVLAWSPLAGGLLAGGYTNENRVTGTRYRYEDVPPRRLEIAQAVAAIAKAIGEPSAAVAFAWLRQRPVPVIPMLGARTSDQMKDLLGLLNLSLSMDCLRQLDDLTAPSPIMPHESLNTSAVQMYFHGGVRDFVDTGDSEPRVPPRASDVAR